jgi:hypothetical protein
MAKDIQEKLHKLSESVAESAKHLDEHKDNVDALELVAKALELQCKTLDVYINMMKPKKRKK